MNNLQKGLAHGFWNSRSQVFRRNPLQNTAPDLLAWAQWGLGAFGVRISRVLKTYLDHLVHLRPCCRRF